MLTPNGLLIDSPAKPLLDADVSYWGITTAIGNAGGTTLVCAGLAFEPSYVNKPVKLMNGNAAGQIFRITTHAGATITVANGFTDSAGNPVQVLAGTLFVIRSHDLSGIAAGAAIPNVQEVVLHPVAPALTTTVAADDGNSPAFYPAAEHSTALTTKANPGIAWSQLLPFEPAGTITVISIYAYFEWQTRWVIDALGTKSSSLIQMSRDGGANWVDVTDQFDNSAIVMTNRIRKAVGLWVPTIVGGATQLGFRLIHFTDDVVGAVSTSKAQVRSNSEVRISYVKS